MSSQNPTIPTPTQAKGVDAVILDLQTHLDTNLVWLTNGQGRAYRLSKIKGNNKTIYLPEVYLGTDRYSYFPATPDNDKKGQSLFITDTSTFPNQQLGFYGIKEFDLGIIFTANLSLIDATLLQTEDFTEHLIIDVQQALIRGLLGKPYRLTINEVLTDFEDVYSEFEVSKDRGIAHTPLTHFRFNCTIQVRENCNDSILDKCGAINQNISYQEKLDCILPTYDFSQVATQDATTPQQQIDLTEWLCMFTTPKSFILGGLDEQILFPIDSAYEFEYNTPFTLSCWVKFDTLKISNLFNKYQLAGADRGYFFILLTDGSLRFDMQNDGGFKGLSIATNGGVISTGSWYHLVLTYAGTPSPSSLSIYINGVDTPINTLNDTLGNNTIKSNATNLRIGTNSAENNGVDGFMSDSLLWQTELTQSEVTSEYNRVLSGTPVQSVDNIAWIKGATDSQFGVDTFTQIDSSGTVTGVKTVNISNNDTSLDVPT